MGMGIQKIFKIQGTSTFRYNNNKIICACNLMLFIYNIDLKGRNG